MIHHPPYPWNYSPDHDEYSLSDVGGGPSTSTHFVPLPPIPDNLFPRSVSSAQTVYQIIENVADNSSQDNQLFGKMEITPSPVQENDHAVMQQQQQQPEQQQQQPQQQQPLQHITTVRGPVINIPKQPHQTIHIPQPMPQQQQQHHVIQGDQISQQQPRLSPGAHQLTAALQQQQHQEQPHPPVTQHVTNSVQLPVTTNGNIHQNHVHLPTTNGHIGHAVQQITLKHNIIHQATNGGQQRPLTSHVQQPSCMPQQQQSGIQQGGLQQQQSGIQQQQQSVMQQQQSGIQQSGIQQSGIPQQLQQNSMQQQQTGPQQQQSGIQQQQSGVQQQQNNIQQQTNIQQSGIQQQGGLQQGGLPPQQSGIQQQSVQGSMMQQQHQSISQRQSLVPQQQAAQRPAMQTTHEASPLLFTQSTNNIDKHVNSPASHTLGGNNSNPATPLHIPAAAPQPPQQRHPSPQILLLPSGQHGYITNQSQLRPTINVQGMQYINVNSADTTPNVVSPATPVTPHPTTQQEFTSPNVKPSNLAQYATSQLAQQYSIVPTSGGGGIQVPNNNVIMIQPVPSGPGGGPTQYQLAQLYPLIQAVNTTNGTIAAIPQKLTPHNGDAHIDLTKTPNTTCHPIPTVKREQTRCANSPSALINVSQCGGGATDKTIFRSDDFNLSSAASDHNVLDHFDPEVISMILNNTNIDNFNLDNQWNHNLFDNPPNSTHSTSSNPSPISAHSPGT